MGVRNALAKTKRIKNFDQEKGKRGGSKKLFEEKLTCPRVERPWGL